MTEARTPLPLRNDTLLGVCQALGEDFGFNPQLLRIVFAMAMVWQPVNVVLAYLALGAAVFLSRLIFPVKTSILRTGRIGQPAAASSGSTESVHEPEPELAEAA